MLKVSKRAAATIFSPIRKFAPLVAAAESRGVKVYKLNSGDPDIAPPSAFLRAVKNYPSKNLRYVVSSGAPEHLKGWIKYYKNLGVKLEDKNIIPTVGCAEAILFAMQLVADSGEEIIVFEPVYVSYRSFATMTGVRLVPITLRSENNFVLPPEKEIAKKITKKTRAIVVINPDNPTGKLWTSKELAVIASLAKKFGLFLIADETYREIRFTGQSATLLTDPSLRDNLIVVDSASKRFSLPGARLGCIVSYNGQVMQSALKFAQARLSVGTLEQYALTPLLKDAQNLTLPLKKEYLRRRNTVYQELKKIPGVKCNRPEGAFYVCARLPVKSAEDFVRFMVAEFEYHEQTVAVSPLKDFYLTPGLGEQEIRIAYVLSVPKLRRAIKLLGLGLAAYLKQNLT